MRTENRSRLLLITDHFPPEQSGGTGRTASLWRYLPEFGIEVFVITLDYYGSTANETHILRYQSSLGWRKTLLSRRTISKLQDKIKSLRGSRIDRWWIRQVMNDTERIKALNCDLVYATYPSSTALELGRLLAALLKKPLLAEFRDGLNFDPVEEISRLQTRAYLEFEKKIVSSAHSVLTISKVISAYFRQTYQNIRVHTVHNGFLKDDYNTVSEADPQLADAIKIRFVHFGSLLRSRKRDITPLFAALALLRQEKSITPDNFQLDFIGSFTKQEKEMIQEYGLDDILRMLPPMDKRAGLQMISQNYDYLLFYGVEDTSGFISAKLPEYLRLGKPILGICAGNEAAEIISQTGTGEVCGFTKAEICSCFKKFIRREMRYQPNQTEISRFDRQIQTASIAEIINRIINHE